MSSSIPSRQYQMRVTEPSIQETNNFLTSSWQWRNNSNTNKDVIVLIAKRIPLSSTQQVTPSTPSSSKQTTAFSKNSNSIGIQNHLHSSPLDAMQKKLSPEKHDTINQQYFTTSNSYTIPQQHQNFTQAPLKSTKFLSPITQEPSQNTPISEQKFPSVLTLPKQFSNETIRKNAPGSTRAQHRTAMQIHGSKHSKRLPQFEQHQPAAGNSYLEPDVVSKFLRLQQQNQFSIKTEPIFPFQPSQQEQLSSQQTSQVLMKSSKGFTDKQVVQSKVELQKISTPVLDAPTPLVKSLNAFNKHKQQQLQLKSQEQIQVSAQQLTRTSSKGQLNRYKLFADVARSTLNNADIESASSSFSISAAPQNFPLNNNLDPITEYFSKQQQKIDESNSLSNPKQSVSSRKTYSSKRGVQEFSQSPTNRTSNIEASEQKDASDSSGLPRIISRKNMLYQNNSGQFLSLADRRLSDANGSPDENAANMAYEEVNQVELAIYSSQTKDPLNPRQLLRVNPYKLKYMELQQRKAIIAATQNQAIYQNFNQTASDTFKQAVQIQQNIGPTTTQVLYKYCVGYGNNAELIRRVMKNRDRWTELSHESGHPVFSGYNFRWSQTNQGIKYERLTQAGSIKQCVNHFEEHKELSEKDGLVRNLKLFCEANKINLFDITPATFLIDLNDDTCEQKVTKFANFFSKHNPLNTGESSSKKMIADFKKELSSLFSSPNVNYKKISQNEYSKPLMHSTFFHQSSPAYIWLLKAAIFNRGRGIELFSSLPVLEKLIKEYSQGIYDKNLNLAVDNHNDATENTNIKPWQILKSQTFVIQKYIERPMLIKGRKFDMRMFVLVTHNLDCHFYKAGYIRTASEIYRMDDLDNQFIHLTNNAVQKYAKNYGEHEQGNILSLESFEELARLQYGDKFNLRERVIPTIREICLMTLASVKKKLNANDRKSCFELFGYDFFIDEEYKVWLIEVNSNPSIEESNDYLKQFMPRLIDDTFKLTIDNIFPKAQKVNKLITRANIPGMEETDKEKKVHVHLENEVISEGLPGQEEEEAEDLKKKDTRKKEIFSLSGHPDNENLWQFMVNLTKFNYSNYVSTILSQTNTQTFHPLREFVAPITQNKKQTSKRQKEKQ